MSASEQPQPQAIADLSAQPIRILLLEDDAADAALIEAILEADDLAFTLNCVGNVGEFVLAHEEAAFDIVLADFNLPGFDGAEALAMTRKRFPDVPFIFVSAGMGEELAIESLRSGATDCVAKDRLARLPQALRRALREAESRREHERLEKKFIEAQKMEVVGHLAAGVAHDFNNIVGIILGYSDLLLQKLAGDATARGNVETSRHAAERAAGLTRQLLIFSRGQTLQPTIIDLNQVVADLDKMLRRLIGENIDLTVKMDPDAGHIKADSGYVGQVLMNLVVNARDAMPGGGELRVSTRNVSVKAADLADSRVPRGDYAVLSICDSGIGMSPEVQARLFEAFFTTKPKGKGTGLGLATCHTIVKQCGGYIVVESASGKGSTFEVYFPRVDLPLDAIARERSGAALPRGTETILLVEDEPAVRQLAAEILERVGYHVLRAGNGEEGLRVARQYSGAPISLVITDVVMPRMSGAAMAECLKNQYKHLKILFTSGYTNEVVTSCAGTNHGVAFLPKPYTPATLAKKTRELLDLK